MERVKAVYTGELSGTFVPELGITVQRDVPFDCPVDWLDARMKVEPERWRRSDNKATVKVASKG